MKLILITLLFFILNHSHGQTLYPCKQKDLWGFKNENGDLAIKYQYDSVTPFINGLAVLYEGYGRLTVVNKRGEPLFTKANAFSIDPFYYDYAICFTRNRREVLVDKKGNEITEYAHLEVINNDWALITERDKVDLYSIKNRKRASYNKFDELNRVKTGTSMVFVTKLNGLYGFIDEKGDEVVKPQCNYIDQLREIVPKKYETLSIFKLVIPSITKEETDGGYVIIEQLNDKYKLISKNNFEGIIDNNGKTIIPLEWTLISLYGDVFFAEYFFYGAPYRYQYYDLNGKAIGNCD